MVDHPIPTLYITTVLIRYVICCFKREIMSCPSVSRWDDHSLFVRQLMLSSVHYCKFFPVIARSPVLGRVYRYFSYCGIEMKY